MDTKPFQTHIAIGSIDRDARTLTATLCFTRKPATEDGEIWSTPESFRFLHKWSRQNIPPVVNESGLPIGHVVAPFLDCGRGSLYVTLVIEDEIFWRQFKPSASLRAGFWGNVLETIVYKSDRRTPDKNQLHGLVIDPSHLALWWAEDRDEVVWQRFAKNVKPLVAA
jgi:hypothetical protein